MPEPSTSAERGERDEHELVRTIAKAVRAADREFETSGGSSRHWVRDHFLPHLYAAGLMVVEKPPKDPDA